MFLSHMLMTDEDDVVLYSNRLCYLTCQKYQLLLTMYDQAVFDVQSQMLQ
jgi:hypothetical protein